MGKSLMDGMDDVGVSKSSRGKGGGSDVDTAKMVKIGVASVLLLLAALVLAWNFGLIGGESIPQATPDAAREVEQQIEEAIQEEERLLIERPDLVPAGSG